MSTFADFDEAVALANGHGYGLSASIYTTDPEDVFRFRERVSAGMVSVNNSTSGAEAHLPFGGNGRSGNGARQSGVWVLDQFTRWQAMNWDYSGRLQKAQMDVVDVAADLSFRLRGAVTEPGVRIRAGLVVDVVAGEVLHDRVIGIRGERIEAVEPTTELRSTSTCRITPCCRA